MGSLLQTARQDIPSGYTSEGKHASAVPVHRLFTCRLQKQSLPLDGTPVHAMPLTTTLAKDHH